jgi:RNA polymerase sigma-70 factor (ECF subfamily)
MNLNIIHSQFHNSLHNYIKVRVNDRDDAADILQEVFIKIASKLDSLTDGEKLKGWIFTITRNTIIDYYRKKSNVKRSVLTDQLIDEVPQKEEFEPTHGLDSCLGDFIQRLPLEYREIIIDSEINGIKQKDLAEKYNLAYPSIRSRVQRGRSRLKEMLLDCCRIELDSRGNVMSATPKKTGDIQQGNR